MAQIEQSDKGGKKKKGAQKKMSIHVDFTPMVDMNMLLITFFMLCTTMIKSQTLQIVLPTNEDVKKENQNQAKASEAITMILDTEYNGDKPAVDAETGKTIHNIYYYEGVADTTFSTNKYLTKEQFIGNQNRQPQGIRKILRGKNEAVMAEYEKLKTQWKNKEITKEEFDKAAKKNASDSNKVRPVVVIKPGPNTTYEGLINAVDEMNINQISRYSIELPTHTDTVLLRHYEQANNETIIRPLVRKTSNQ
ncbi:biopolymer transporter ExbD [uncultured Muribaculum sp.]|jgi:biopolymer transport protein ExbD|uniref:biopolymer transporter ExbD n=1 Tax=uncultured Muribaculum sp. TaxID=1918613 RepID=UPI0025B779D4|nr:biopolymer transporter ExbD [uncultured Muribaculum sp.]